MDKCFECESDENIHNHHVIPKDSGGTKTVPLCGVCYAKVNSESKKREVIDWDADHMFCVCCKIVKPINEFSSYKIKKRQRICKVCVNVKKREYRKKNPGKRREEKKRWREKYPEKRREERKRWKAKNPDLMKQYKRKSVISKLETDPVYRVIVALRKRTRNFLKSLDVAKKGSSVEFIGLNNIDFRQYIEDKFIDGMSWDNYGVKGWHIDHIIPLSSATTEEEAYKLCHYTNLQPLWAEENIRKSNKIL